MSARAGYLPAPVPEDLGGARDRIHVAPKGAAPRASRRAARAKPLPPPERVPAHRRGRHGHGAARALRDGTGHLDDAPDDGRRGARVRLESKIRVETAPAAPVYAHTALRRADDGRLDDRPGRSSTATGRSARWRARCSSPRRPRSGRSSPPTAAPRRASSSRARRRASYGSLAKAAQASKPPAAVKLKDRKDWKIIGKPTKRLDSPQKVTGKAQFGIDVQLPGMKTALVARSPVFGGKVKGFRAEKAKAVPGVRAVVEVPSGVAVVADHFWAAKLGRDALEIDWDLGAGATLDTAAMARGVPGARGKGRPQGRRGRRRERGARRGEEDRRGRVRLPLPRPRDDGAAQLRREDRARRLRDLDRDAVPDRRPGRRPRRSRA